MPLTSFLHPLSPSFPSSCLPFFVPSYPPSFLCLLLPHLRDKASRFSPYGANCGYFTDALYLVEGVPFYSRCVEFYHGWVLDFFNALFTSIKMIVLPLYIINVVYYSNYINAWMSKQPCIPGISSFWAW